MCLPRSEDDRERCAYPAGVADLLVIVSKAVFEKQARRGGKLLAEGEVFATDRYVSEAKAIEPVAGGGSLFLVTVRPEPERLWLVAVLDAPEKRDGAWIAKANTQPIRDVTALLPSIRLESGKGIQAKPGALGMSLQTPRILADADVALLRGEPAPAGVGASNAVVPQPIASVPAPRAEKPVASAPKKPAPPPLPPAPDGIRWTDEARRACVPRTADEVRGKRVKDANALQRFLDLTFDARKKDPALSLTEPSLTSNADLVAVLSATSSGAEVNEMLDLIARLFGGVRAVEIVWEMAASRDAAWSTAALRPALLLAPPDQKEAARERARSLWAAGGNRTQHLALAYAFFDEKEWARSAATRWLEPGAPKHVPTAMLLAIAPDAETARSVLAARQHYNALFDLVAQLGTDALTVLIDNFKTTEDVYDLGHTAEALALFPSEEVARLFVGELGKKQVRKPAAAFFHRFPHIAQAILPEVAAGKTKIAKLAAELLAQAGRVTEQPETEEAEDDALPHALVTPPYAGKPPKRKPLVVPDAKLDVPPPALRWTTLDRQAELAAAVDARIGTTRLLTDAEAEALLPRYVPVGTDSMFYWVVGLASGERAAWSPVQAMALLERGVTNGNNAETPTHVLAKAGARAVPAVLAAVRRGRSLYGLKEVVREVHSAELAAALVKIPTRASETAVWEYMLAHADVAILGLIPIAIGPLGDERTSAEEALRMLAERGHREAIVAAAARAGEAASAAVAEVLGQDAAMVDFKKPPRLSETFRPATLTRPKLQESGARVSLAVLENLALGLALSEPWRAHPIVRAAVDACDPRSLAELSWDLAQAWYLGGRRERDRWMVESLVHLADDEVVRRTTPAIKDDEIVKVLGWIPTHASATELFTILARGEGQNRPTYSPWIARDALLRVARLRGTTLDELEDRVVDTLGLDAKGKLVLDLGARSVRVRIDARLEPLVLDEDGTVLKAFPAARKDDDPTKVGEARARFSEIQEDVRAITVRRLAALRRAMETRRAWRDADFKAVWAQHPFQRHLAATVVWKSADRTFRVTEDATFADEHDEEVRLAEDAEVRVARYDDMSDATRRAWGERFSEYRILTHLPQLERERESEHRSA